MVWRLVMGFLPWEIVVTPLWVVGRVGVNDMGRSQAMPALRSFWCSVFRRRQVIRRPR